MSLRLCLIVATLALTIIINSQVESSPTQAKCSPAKERMRRALFKDVSKNRKRRTIEVPAKTYWQCKWALNIPLETQERHSAKIQISLPMKINFPAYLFDEYAKDKFKGYYPYEEETYGKDRYGSYDYNEDDKEINDNSHLSKRSIDEVMYSRASQNERVYLYRHVEGFLDRLGLPGHECVQRTVCELADEPLDHGLMGDWMNMFFSPSSATNNVDQENIISDLPDFLTAEKHGRTKGRCHSLYESCPASFFDLLPVVSQIVFGTAGNKF